MQIWREDYTSESTLQGVPFFNICIRVENANDIQKFFDATEKKDDKILKSIDKLAKERGVLK